MRLLLYLFTVATDKDGQVSLGVSPDFGPLILSRSDLPVLALINPMMPAPPYSPKVPLARFALVAEEARALVSVPPAPLAPTFAGIARHIAALLPDGAALQFGIGNVQQAILTELAGRKGLSIHSGIVSDPVIGLLDADPDLQVTTGVAVGTAALYDRLAQEPRVRFLPVSETHALARLAALPRFAAINSVLEVDLLGQANAEFIRGRQVSGTGGLTDFLRGARASEGGLGITALVSTAAGGTVSRIVPRLADSAVTVTRADMDIVITEHGAARLRDLDLDARAAVLVHPHRGRRPRRLRRLDLARQQVRTLEVLGVDGDPLARSPSRPIQPECTPRTQQAWLNRYLPIVLAKTYVQGILWTQLHDHAPHDFAHGGLFDLRRHPKPALRTLASMRQAFL